jgi:hypothetical protein
VCGRPGRKVEHVTYIGAPKGGVPVHYRCLQEFFQLMDASPFWQLPGDVP